MSANELVPFEIYFSVQFLDDALLIPIVEPLVYLGADLRPEDSGRRYFQDAESFRGGVRFESAAAGEAVFYAQQEDGMGHIFKYSLALEELMKCSLRRKASDQIA